MDPSTQPTAFSRRPRSECRPRALPEGLRNRWVGLVVIALWCAGAPSAHSGSADLAPPDPRSLDVVAHTYTTPKALAGFLQRTMTFKSDEELFGEPDYWQDPEEFLARRAGDCEDYALFAQAVLQRRGIEAYVLSVFGRDGYAHTVCVFAEAGRYNVINQDRVRYVRAKTLETVAGRLYPGDRKSTRLNSSHGTLSRMPSSA